MSNVTPTWNKVSVVGSEMQDNASNVTPTWNKLSVISESVPTFTDKQPKNVEMISRSVSLVVDHPPQQQQKQALPIARMYSTEFKYEKKPQL